MIYCGYLIRCRDTQRLLSLKRKDLRPENESELIELANLQDQYENLCSLGNSLNQGTLRCTSREGYIKEAN